MYFKTPFDKYKIVNLETLIFILHYIGINSRTPQTNTHLNDIM